MVTDMVCESNTGFFEHYRLYREAEEVSRFGLSRRAVAGFADSKVFGISFLGEKIGAEKCQIRCLPGQ